jgi:hypothetical protein
MRNRPIGAYVAVVQPCPIDKEAYRWVIVSSDGERRAFSQCAYFLKRGAQTAGDYRARELAAKAFSPR